MVVSSVNGIKEDEFGNFESAKIIFPVFEEYPLNYIPDEILGLDEIDVVIDESQLVYLKELYENDRKQFVRYNNQSAI